MSDDFFAEIERINKEQKKREAEIKAEKKRQAQKAEMLRRRKESAAYQEKCNQYYSSSSTDSSKNYQDGDAGSLYEKYSKKNYSAYKDEVANYYGAHNDGYSNISSEYALNRGMGAGPTQKVHLASRLNTHSFDSSAPRIHVRLQNTWTPSQPANTQTNTAQQPTYNLSGRPFAGRSNGKLGGRF